jgi:hypothetical protein
VAPATVFEVRFNAEPAQIGEFDPTVGAEGLGFTVTVTDADTLVHPLTVTVAEYVPEVAVVVPEMEGSSDVEVKPFGPVQLYVPPATVLAVRFSVEPAQIGVFDPSVKVVGVVFTVTTVVPAELGQPFTVTVTEYVPAAALVALATDGSSSVDVKPLGPVQEYVPPATVFAVKFNVWLVHIGELDPAVGADGIAFTVTATVAAALVHPLTV